MQYGLPRLEQPAQPEDATEQIKRLGEFARDMAQWLINFAKGMHTCIHANAGIREKLSSIDGGIGEKTWKLSDD